MATSIRGVDELFDSAGDPLELGGGGGSFAGLKAFLGASISLASGSAQTFTNNTEAELVFDTDDYDLGGWIDDTTNKRLQVPSGVTKAEFTAGISVDTLAGAGIIQVSLYEETAGLVRRQQEEIPAPGAPSNVLVNFGVLDVAAGEVYYIQVLQDGGANEPVPVSGQTDPAYFTATALNFDTSFALPFPHIGTRVDLSGAQSISSATETEIDWTTEVATIGITFDPNDGGEAQRFWLGVDQTFVDGDVTVGTDVVNITGHGFVTGEGPVRLTNSGGALPTGLSTGTNYWIIRDDDDNLRFALSRANAIAGTDVDITAAAGGGTHTIETETWLVVPAGVTKMQFRASYATNNTAEDDVRSWISKNEETLPGQAYGGYRGVNNNPSGVCLDTGVIEVTEGDRYELRFLFGANTDINANDGTWFECAVIETSDAAVLTEHVVGTLHVREEQTSGTAGGASTGASQNTRVLNTTVTNTIDGASLGSNQITLDPGTYEVEASAPAFQSDAHKLRLRDTTGSATLIVGQSAHSRNGSNGDGTMAHLSGRFTLAAQSVLELQHYIATGLASNGLGVATSSGDVEVYAEVIIRKLGN